MTNQLEKVSSTNIDGIDFYCSVNGEDTGMSEAGLAKFTGLARSSTGRLIGTLDRPAQFSFPKQLERWNTVSIYHENLSALKDTKDARILKAEFCADVCSYVAYDHKGGNKIARYSLSKFASIGIRNFIQEVTGHSKPVDSSAALNQILGALSNLTAKVDEMSIELASTSGYRKARVTYPGLTWCEEVEVDQVLYLPDSDMSWYTVNEAIDSLFPTISFTKGNKISIGMMVAATWKMMKLETPAKVVRINNKGHKMVPVAAYPADFLPVVKNSVLKFITNI